MPPYWVSISIPGWLVSKLRTSKTHICSLPINRSTVFYTDDTVVFTDNLPNTPKTDTMCYHIEEQHAYDTVIRGFGELSGTRRLLTETHHRVSRGVLRSFTSVYRKINLLDNDTSIELHTLLPTDEEDHYPHWTLDIRYTTDTELTGILDKILKE